MAMRSPMYKHNKRKKELLRQKKQEEKRLRRQKNAKGDEGNGQPANVDPEPRTDGPDASAGSED